MHYALSTAIKNNELFVLYQPQINVADRKVVAAEALLRWERPGLGPVSPSDFVPYAEEHDLIDPLGIYILERACRDARAWKGVRLAVNVSQKQFARPDLADFICGVAQDCGLDLCDFEVEITETADFPDRAKAVAQLKILRERGVIVSLDDLGSGNATIDLMAALPLSRVKIGRPMIGACETHEGADRLRTLVAAAQALGHGITAEGVETHEEYVFLREIGCDLMQGYFFAKPMASDDIMAFAAGIEKS
jgi:EAL domain-containing protein (putative c-di-GMP-specific phosphodiesterase class I)